jgi:hypothetical protein
MLAGTEKTSTKGRVVFKGKGHYTLTFIYALAGTFSRVPIRCWMIMQLK